MCVSVIVTNMRLLSRGSIARVQVTFNITIQSEDFETVDLLLTDQTVNITADTVYEFVVQQVSGLPEFIAAEVGVFLLTYEGVPLRFGLTLGHYGITEFARIDFCCTAALLLAIRFRRQNEIIAIMEHADRHRLQLRTRRFHVLVQSRDPEQTVSISFQVNPTTTTGELYQMVLMRAAARVSDCRGCARALKMSSLGMTSSCASFPSKSCPAASAQS